MRLGVDASTSTWTHRCRTSRHQSKPEFSQAAMVALARRENLTVRDLARMVGGYGGLTMPGTPAEIADQMQTWLETEASDGSI